MSQASTRQAAPNVPTRPSPPQQLGQLSSCPIGVQSLLNPLKVEHHVNAGSAPGTISEKTTCPPGSTISYVPTLPWARLFPPRQPSLAPIYSQPQSCERAGAIKPASPQLAFQSDSPGTQYSACGQVRHTEPNMAPSTSFTSQLQSSLSNSFPSSGPYSTTSQAAFGTEGQYPTMTLETENGPLQIPIDVQAGSKVAGDKRKRNATASQRFRQRREEKERETSQKISKLEQQIQETMKEREFYRGERDDYRNIATRTPSRAQLLPRPLSPRLKRHIPFVG